MIRSRMPAVAMAALLLGGCGPSKDEMCHEIADYRAQSSGVSATSAEATEYYVKCLNAPDDYAKRMYKEIKAGK